MNVLRHVWYICPVNSKQFIIQIPRMRSNHRVDHILDPDRRRPFILETSSSFGEFFTYLASLQLHQKALLVLSVPSKTSKSVYKSPRLETVFRHYSTRILGSPKRMVQELQWNTTRPPVSVLYQ